MLTDSWQVGNQLVYRYDYGNDWYHLLTLLQVAEPSQVCPRLVRLAIPTPSQHLPMSPNRVICELFSASNACTHKYTQICKYTLMQTDSCPLPRPAVLAYIRPPDWHCARW